MNRDKLHRTPVLAAPTLEPPTDRISRATTSQRKKQSRTTKMTNTCAPHPPRPRRRSVGPRRPWRRRVLITTLTIAIASATAFWGGGYQLFYREHQDPLRHVDAVVVLGGDNDGREAYGMRLVEAGYADTLVVSNPYPFHKGSDQDRRTELRRLCRSSTSDIKVVCFEPEPATTEGEARFVSKIAESRGWTSVVVISWRYHIVRARYIFGQCYPGDVVMRSVPRSYDRSAGDWTQVFAYQYAAFGKAIARGCDLNAKP